MQHIRTLSTVAAVVAAMMACSGERQASSGDSTQQPEMPQVATPPAVLEETAVDSAPRRVTGPTIAYPEALRNEGVEGRVVLSAVVGIDGAVEEGSVHILTATHAEFEQAARAWIEEARFTPGSVDGTPVRTRVEIPVEFRLDGK